MAQALTWKPVARQAQYRTAGIYGYEMGSCADDRQPLPGEALLMTSAPVTTHDEASSRHAPSGSLADDILEREVCDFMTPGCLTISEDASVAQAAAAMSVHRCTRSWCSGASNGTPLGWVTARGLLGWLGRDRASQARATRSPSR